MEYLLLLFFAVDAAGFCVIDGVQLFNFFGELIEHI
jgi:hypothetical protein